MIFSAIIFDMDGLMLDTEKLACEAWKRAAADFGFKLEEETFYSLVGNAIPFLENGIKLALGQGFPLQEARDLKQHYFEKYIIENGIPLKPGLLELLAYIDKSSLKKAVASSTHRKFVIQRLKITGLIDQFDLMVCGDEIQRGKPDPDIFLRTAEHLNVIPRECIVLEDADAGIRAAHAADMFAIIIPDKKEPDTLTKELADKIFTSLFDVIPFLETQLPPGGQSAALIRKR